MVSGYISRTNLLPLSPDTASFTPPPVTPLIRLYAFVEAVEQAAGSLLNVF